MFLGLLNNFGWLFGILPVIFILPLVFPDGHLPSPRWRPFLWFILAFLALISVSFVIGQATLSGSNEQASVAEPVLRGGDQAPPEDGRRDRRCCSR